MSRTTKWPDKDEMWLQCARWRSGGLTYDQIAARLSSAEYRKQFDLIEVPKADTIRYQLKRRSLAGKPAEPGSVLAEDELESHMRALIYFGLLLRARTWAPGIGEIPSRLDLERLLRLDSWAGFATMEMRVWELPEPGRVEEMEAEGLWPEGSGDPRQHPLFEYLDQHLVSTERGAEIAGLLEKLFQQAEKYLTAARRFLSAVREDADTISRDTQRGTRIARSMHIDQLVGRLHPTDAKRTRKAGSKGRQPFEPGPQLRSTASAVEETWRPLAESMKAFRAAVTPTHLLMRVVREGRCDICA